MKPHPQRAAPYEEPVVPRRMAFAGDLMSPIFDHCRLHLCPTMIIWLDTQTGQGAISDLFSPRHMPGPFPGPQLPLTLLGKPPLLSLLFALLSRHLMTLAFVCQDDALAFGPAQLVIPIGFFCHSINVMHRQGLNKIFSSSLLHHQTGQPYTVVSDRWRGR